MAGGKLVPLYEQVVRRIEQQIESGRFSAGDKLYSIREMCEQFNVSDVTAKKALRLLSARGVIRTVTGSGVFVEDQTKRAAAPVTQKPLVAFLKMGMQPIPIFVYEIDLIQRELAAVDHPMLYSVVSQETETEQALQQALAAGAGCLLVFPQHRGDFESSDFMRVLRRSDLPLLIVESRSSKDSYVTADTERATAELVHYLYECGHRRICLASGFHRKVSGFEQAIAGYHDPALQGTSMAELGRSEADAQELSRQILELKPRPTAVIASNDQPAAAMVRHFLAAGLRVPQDISVVTYGDHPQFAGLSPLPLTVMRHPFQELAQEVAAWVHGHYSRDTTRRRFRRELSGSLIIRDSSGPAPAPTPTA